MITIKRGDTYPDLSVTCTDNGAVVDLTPATGVKVIGSRDGVVLFSRATTGSAIGVVTMPWTAPDTANPGMITVEIETTWPGGKVQTFPADSVLYINVAPDLG